MFQLLVRESAPRAAIAALTRVHPPEYVAAIEQASPSRGRIQLDADTAMSPGTWEAALRSAGGGDLRGRRSGARAGRQRLRRDAAARPPRRDRDGRWGFASSTTPRSPPATPRPRTGSSASRSSISTCITATARRTSSGPIKSVMYASTHQMPLYPGTGARSECGEHDKIVNAPLRAGDGGEAFREAFATRRSCRAWTRFAPDLVIVSAGVRRALSRSARQSQPARGRFRLGDARR